MKKRVIVIGGGPGGYVAAIRAAQLGAEVHVAESGRVGGTCLNEGCIPTKSLLRSASFYRQVKEGAVAGVRAEGVTLDWAAAQAHKAAVVEGLVNGVGGLLAANGVTLHRGRAAFTGPRAVAVEGRALPPADAVIIASGSVPARLGFPGADLPQVVDSTGALALAKAPESVCIVGGGVIGVEFASMFMAAGARVSIVEMLPDILPTADRQAAETMRGLLERDGAEILTGARLSSVKEGRAGVAASEIALAGGLRRLESELVLIAVGRKANIEGLCLDRAGIRTDRGAIAVDEGFETNVKGVFAVGDCNARHMLAHAASAQGEAAAERAMGAGRARGIGPIPYCLYTSPEMAGVGLTEEQAGGRAAVGVFDLGANGRAMIDGGGGFVKVIADRESGELLGVHMLGPHVTEMVAEAAVAMGMEGLVEDITGTVHAHPTVSEAVREAALSVFGDAIHWPPGTRR
ncbi:MAG: dihydrolipoyl dehydrogenase [Clostridiales Family XIII bacterium]|jgi:dihydrolipoamide dehydrogenase|nr:dihydrolipoyl dehydrogenase [Clostridiales Family XIII bacterium]